MEHHKLRLEGVDMEHLSSVSRAGLGAKLETKLAEQLNIAKAIGCAVDSRIKSSYWFQPFSIWYNFGPSIIISRSYKQVLT